jgi:hypothetical protein
MMMVIFKNMLKISIILTTQNYQNGAVVMKVNGDILGNVIKMISHLELEEQ